MLRVFFIFRRSIYTWLQNAPFKKVRFSFSLRGMDYAMISLINKFNFIDIGLNGPHGIQLISYKRAQHFNNGSVFHFCQLDLFFNWYSFSILITVRIICSPNFTVLYVIRLLALFSIEGCTRVCNSEYDVQIIQSMSMRLGTTSFIVIYLSKHLSLNLTCLL